MLSSSTLTAVFSVGLAGSVVALIVTEVAFRVRTRPRPTPAAVLGREALDAIDRGLRNLAVECVRAERTLPDVYAVTYSGERLTLRLAGSDSIAPAPWNVNDQGEEWWAEPERLNDTGRGDSADAVHPYALTVTVGLEGGERVLVDLSRAAAAISVTGSDGDVRQLVRAMVAELITGPVGRDAEVTLVGSAAHDSTAITSGLQSTRLHTAATLREALGRAEGASQASAEFLAAAPVTQVYRLIQGRNPGALRDRAPRLFVMAAAQYREERESVSHLAPADALLVLGDAPDSGWCFRIAADGSLDTASLGLRVGRHAGRPA
ncbi:hypothetical protein [Streptomyces sp. NPDC086787]|uniref:hypothetical protein n=1 Tax=Streptomyces sp. NPDC086787 TaxID=3365759 RepID=UPI0038124F19